MRPAAFITGITGMAVVAGLLLAGEARLGGGYDLNKEGIDKLLADLRCLQCRALLLEWLHNK